VREILLASGKLGDKEDLGMKFARLQKKLDELKAEMRKDMEDKLHGVRGCIPGDVLTG